MDVVVGHGLLVFGLLSVISLTSATGVATESSGTWSNWINAGSPAGTGVDDESLDRLVRMSQLPCDPSAVMQVECRKVGSGVTFSEQRIFVDNVLQVPCNTSGLVCRDADQSQGVRCSDYEIRVLCSGVTGKTSGGDSSGSSGGGIGSNGGFIAMAAGGSVVIPLVCVLVVQLRKSKRDERRRALQAARAASQSAQVEQAACGQDAPPTYDELFGSSETRLSTTSTNTNTSTSSADSGIDVGSADMLIVNELRTPSRPSVTSDYSITSAESLLSSSSSSSLPPVTAVMSSAPSTIVTTPSLEAVDEPVTTVVTDMSLQASEASPSVTIDSTSNVGVSVRRESFASDLSETASHSSADAFLTSSSASTTLVHSDHLSDTTSHSSADGLLTSSSNLVHNDPPPPYDFHNPSREERAMGERCRSCGRSSSSNSSDDDSNSSCNVSVSSEQPQRRFLGMHLSIHDLLAVIYQEGERASTPPPTYDDALKIIGVQGQPKVPTTQ